MLKDNLNQYYRMKKDIEDDPALNKHFILDDIEGVLDKLSMKQYRLFLYLQFNKKRSQLNEFMLSIGFERDFNN